MSEELTVEEKQRRRALQSARQEMTAPHPRVPATRAAAALRLQRQAGNRAVQRLLARRKAGEGFELDDTTAARINSARSGGRPLDSATQQQMGARVGYDLSHVNVHSDGEADELSQELHARAFTTGRDIFFRQGAYDPGSSSGQELLVHELSHVVQQGVGRVGGGGRMAVRPAGDALEQEADVAAHAAAGPAHEATGPGAPARVQRQGAPKEEEAQSEPLQRQGAPDEEEPVQGKPLQLQAASEEEEQA